MEPYILDKRIWTEADFDIMGWHDAAVYGFAFENGSENCTGDFLLDIDYIFKWVDPVPPERHFTFWVSPCTLVFTNALKIKIDIDTTMFALEGLQIAGVSLVNKKDNGGGFTYNWLIELQEGTIELQSDGFKQIVRMLPMFGKQSLEMQQRGGISFNLESVVTQGADK